MFHHIETSQLICSANQLTDFYVMGTLVVKRLRRRVIWCIYCCFLTYFTPFSSVPVIDFAQVNVSWVNYQAQMSHWYCFPRSCVLSLTLEKSVS